MKEKRQWTGRWIEPEQENAYKEKELDFAEMEAAQGSPLPSEGNLKCAKHIRKIIPLKNKAGELPLSVTVYASAHGVYDLYINGKKADERLLAPETTNYNILIWYQKYDITEFIKGLDQLQADVLLGDGWWIGRLGMAGSSCNYGDRLGLIMDIELKYPDGSIVTVGSDESFVSCDSFIRYSDLYIGEMQDAGAFDAIDITADPQTEQCGTEAQKADGSYPGWTLCHTAEYPTDFLELQPVPGIRVVRELPVRELIRTPEGDLVADFGQVIAGTVRIKVDTDKGTDFTLEHGEVLDSKGNYYNNIKGMFKDQKDRFICRQGEQVLTPHFTYHGFRYVRIRGISQAEIREITALSWATPLRRTASFETDHAMLNGLQHAIEESTVSNMVSVPTDCPQREKLGWTGDINIFAKTGAFLYDLKDFLASWLYQLRREQTEEGEIPVVVPNHPCQDVMQRGMSGGTDSSAAWSDCCIFLPLNLYKIYGDISFLEDNYEMMERWLAYVQGQTADDLWIHRFHFGDWLIPSLREAPDGVMKGVMATADIVGSCYYSIAVSAMTEVCACLGKTDREEYYRQLLGRINKALVKAYVKPDGRVGDAPLQGLYVVMLQTGAVTEPELKKKMLEHLAGLIREADYTLDCGFASIGFLLDVLYDNGYKDIAYRLLFATKAPSWLYMIRNGATTIWENWRAVREDGTVTDSSYNHYAYGCVGDFMYRHIGGISAAAPGYSRVLVSPDTDCGIRRCHCSHTAATGEIVCSWELDEKTSAVESGHSKGKIHLEIPAGIKAQIMLPGVETELGEGSYDLDF